MAVIGLNSAPVFVRLSVPREYRRPKAGQSLPIYAYVGEVLHQSGNIRLVDLAAVEDGPLITLLRTTNTQTTETTVVNEAVMSRVDIGVYQYIFDTDGESLGNYTGIFRAVNSLPTPNQILLSKRAYLFTLKD